MEETNAIPQGFGRFTKHIVLGAIFGGVLCAIPILSCLNSIFCILNMAGVAFALWLYLKANPEDTLSTGEAVGFGAAAGAGAGLISSVVGMLIGFIFRKAIAAFIATLAGSVPAGAIKYLGFSAPSLSFASFLSAIMSIISIIWSIVWPMALFAAFGALGTFLSMQLFFKSNIRNTAKPQA